VALTASAGLSSYSGFGAEAAMSTPRDDVPTTTSLSRAARIIGPSVSVTLRPLLRRGFARRRRALRAVCAALAQPAAGTQLQQSTLGGVPVEITTPQTWTEARSIVYLHGGAYVALSARSYRRMVTHLAATTGCRVVALDYRLAPEHPYPAALEDAVAAYTAERAARPNEKIILAGDSAGGGLTMATALALRDRGLTPPAAIVCISPWVDLTCTGKSVDTRALRERVLSAAGLAADARLYAGGEELTNPYVSPLFADLHGLPPRLIQVGDDEVLLDDSIRLADAARSAGVTVTLQVWQHLWHVWHLYAGLLPEADAAMRAIADFISDTLGER
jgi:monoterpene epsilon-lactone hydrolase